jgi:uncharacterized protein (TIGR02246 family)
MVFTRKISILAFAGFLLLSLPVASELARAQNSGGTSADSAQIKRVVKDFYENFSRHDAHAVSMLFAEEADFTNMRGVHNHGRSEVQAKMESLFTGNLKSAQRTDIVKSVRFFSPDIAVVDADTVITGTLTANGSVVPPRKGLLTVVMTKQNGHWLISVFHEVEYPEAAAAR